MIYKKAGDAKGGIMKQEKVWATEDKAWPEEWVDDWGDLPDRLMSERGIENEQDLIGEEYFEAETVPVPLRDIVPIDTIIGVLNEKA
jgi:hypothetical protein